MPFVNVRLVAPDGRRYTVDIDTDLDVESVKSQLVQKLELSASKRYSLRLVDSFALSQGDEIMLVDSSDQGVMNLVPTDG
jgi:hypothetical protein